MSILSGKKVLLGISGGIAAYKTPNLVRCLIKKGAEAVSYTHLTLPTMRTV